MTLTPDYLASYWSFRELRIVSKHLSPVLLLVQAASGQFISFLSKNIQPYLQRNLRNKAVNN